MLITRSSVKNHDEENFEPGRWGLIKIEGSTPCPCISRLHKSRVVLEQSRLSQSYKKRIVGIIGLEGTQYVSGIRN